MIGQKKPWGLTLGEAVFVLVVLLFLIGFIVPVLCRVRNTPSGPRCGVHLAGIGKAMLIYAGDYEEELPRAGGPDASWAARTPDWMGENAAEAYGSRAESHVGGQASMSASLYLLVKYTEVAPRTFLCPDGEGKMEQGPSEFRPHAYGVRDKALIDLWDFGPHPPEHVSYAHHMGYGSYRLTMSSDPGMAVAADRNPWIDSPFARARQFTEYTPDAAPFNGTAETALRGNTLAHQGDGQNVLFLDGHVEFVKRSSCGVDDDNIYTSWKGDDKVRGEPARFGSTPAHCDDSLLVNDPAKP